MQHRNLTTIQSLRGCAALMVCMMHMISDDPRQGNLVLLFKRILMSIGGYGVDLFFTISGFIITWIVMRETVLPSLQSAVVFLIKRFFRIYPLFWITIFLFATLLIIFPDYGPANIVTLKQLLYYRVIGLLTPVIPLQYAAWTLPYELYFYFVTFCFVAICPKKYFMLFFSIWATTHAMILLGNHFGILHLSYFIFRNQQILEFFGGVLAGYFLHHYHAKYTVDKYICLCIATLLLGSGFLISYARHSLYYLNHIESFVYLSLSASFLIYAMVGLEMQQRIKMPIVLQKFGDVSYSIYLWHFPMLGVTTILSWKWVFFDHIPLFLRSILEIILVVLISLISYQWIEQPFIRLSHRLVNRIR